MKLWKFHQQNPGCRKQLITSTNKLWDVKKKKSRKGGTYKLKRLRRHIKQVKLMGLILFWFVVFKNLFQNYEIICQNVLSSGSWCVGRRVISMMLCLKKFPCGILSLCLRTKPISGWQKLLTPFWSWHHMTHRRWRAGGFDATSWRCYQLLTGQPRQWGRPLSSF